MKESTTIYEQIGGMKTFRRLVDVFYFRVARDALLRPLFPKKMTRQRARLALFLAETFGGPKNYTKMRGKRSLPETHARFPITAQNTAAWMRNMSAAMKEVGISKPARNVMHGFFCEHTPGPRSDPLKAAHFFSLVELRKRLEQDRSLATKRGYGDTTLLHAAAGAGDRERARLLLDFGADVNAKDHFGHTPLGTAANVVNGAAVAELLIQHGADVNVHSGPTRSTPLHTAARRDNVAIGKLLLAAGADIEARDCKGETPLRRALNCRQPGMIALLVAKGANLDAPDKRGTTPRQYAKERNSLIQPSKAAVRRDEN